MTEEKILQELKKQTALLTQLIAQQGASQAYQWTPEGLPICPRHNEVMPRREKQGDVWYSHKIVDAGTGEVCYCKGYKSGSSPGWDIAPEPGPIKAAQQMADQVKLAPKPIGEPEDYHQAFYSLASEAINAGQVDSGVVNGLVNCGDFEKAYRELRATVV